MLTGLNVEFTGTNLETVVAVVKVFYSQKTIYTYIPDKEIN